MRTSTGLSANCMPASGAGVAAGAGSMRRTRKSCAVGGADCQTFAGVVTVLEPSAAESTVGVDEPTFFPVARPPLPTVTLIRNGAVWPAASCRRP